VHVTKFKFKERRCARAGRAGVVEIIVTTHMCACGVGGIIVITRLVVVVVVVCGELNIVTIHMCACTPINVVW